MTSGRDFYVGVYASQLDLEARWLSYGAAAKADSIEALVRPRMPSPEVVLDLGAGTGAVIRELQSRNFAKRYLAVDFSPDACDYMRGHLTNVEVQQADIVTRGLRSKADVVVLSHVLEHLEEPHSLLRSIASHIDFEWLVIECPLEDLPVSRLKNLFRDRRVNLSGHVQFFDAQSFRALVSEHFEIVDQRHYAPWSSNQVLSFLAGKDKLTWPKQLVKRLTQGYGPRLTAPVWKRLWLGNYAVLCRRKAR